MGILTLSEIRQEVREGLGNRTELASSNTRVDRWINLAQVRMVRRSRFTELNVTEDLIPAYTGVASTDKFIPFSVLTNSNPRAIISVRRIEGDNSQKLVFVPFRLWDRRLPNTEEYGAERPSHYTVYQKKIELWRIPNQAYTYRIRLAKWPTPMTDEAQTSDLDEKDDALICMSKYYAFLSLEKASSAATALAEYNNIMKDVKIENFEEPDYDAVEPNRADSGSAGQYWADPFARSTPR